MEHEQNSDKNRKRRCRPYRRSRVLDLSVEEGVHRRNGHLGYDVVHVPLEVAALQPLTQPLAFVERRQFVGIGEFGAFERIDARRRVEVLAHAVHPRLRHANQVLLNDVLLVAVELVRKFLYREFYNVKQKSECRYVM